VVGVFTAATETNGYREYEGERCRAAHFVAGARRLISLTTLQKSLLARPAKRLVSSSRLLTKSSGSFGGLGIAEVRDGLTELHELGGSFRWTAWMERIVCHLVSLEQNVTK
jgi:hypothetical protein